ncbi:MAG: hypothetical protein ACYSSN_02460, partial [Planctomycetota bacterium]
MILRDDRERWTGFGWLLVPVLLCTFYNVGNGGPVTLRDVTRETGITFIHTDGGCGKYYAVEPFSAGLALFDY